MRIVKRLAIIIFVLIAGTGCDQSTQYLAEPSPPKVEALSFLLGTVSLQVAHNKGGFLSLGESIPKAWRLTVKSYGVSSLLLALLAYTIFSTVVRTPFILAISLIFAGAASKLIDRFVFDNCVVDFMILGPSSLRSGLLNVADIAIFTGVLMLFVTLWRVQKTGGKI